MATVVPKKNAGTSHELMVYELEQLLFKAFPAVDALEDDRVGLLVGDAQAQVTRIAIALDAKIDAIEIAAMYGCNVLLTHHPVYWKPPTLFLREMGTSCSNGAAELASATVFRAAEKGVALIGMHTNLDAAPCAAGMLLDPVGYEYQRPLALPRELARDLTEQLASKAAAGDSRHAANPKKPTAGLGQLGVPRTRGRTKARPATLEELSLRYEEAFGAVAKVWGDPATEITLLATCSGGGGELVARVIASGADCYVTGEVRYHEALELAAAGVALIELGHDRSELPYRFYLRDALLAAGIAEERIQVIEPLVSWWQPWKESQ